MEFVANIHTSGGVIECLLSRHELHGKEVIFADLWRGKPHMGSIYTEFRAAVYLQWDGQCYRIIRRRPADYANAFWLHLEQLISNTIVINE